MVLKFEFEYVSDNDFFEFLLCFYARNLKFSLEKRANAIIFKVQGVENEINAFCASLESLPNSVFVRDFSVKVLENEGVTPSEIKENFAKKDFLTSLNSKAFLENGALLENEWGEFVNDSISFDGGASFSPINRENFKAVLDESLAVLSVRRGFLVKNERGVCEVGLLSVGLQKDFLNSQEFAKQNSKQEKAGLENSAQNGVSSLNLRDKFLMATEIKALKTAFVCSNDNLKLLASLEKPLMRLRFSAIFRNNHDLKISEFRLKLPHNLFFFALGERLFGRGENFLTFTKRENLGDEFEIYELNKELIVLRGLDFINERAKKLILSKDDKNMARISYILSRFDKSALLLELSQSYDDILLIDKERNLLNLSLPRSAKQIYADICADEVGQRLFDNFRLNFKLLSGEFELKNNFFSLLGLVGQLLELNEKIPKNSTLQLNKDIKIPKNELLSPNKNDKTLKNKPLTPDNSIQAAARRLLELADKSKMPRGVKIDYRVRENSKDFDYTRTVRSVMSFMLAGVDGENIAYGAVESLAYFLRDFYDELREKGLVECAIISGSLFESRALAKNTLKHLKNSKASDVPLWI